MLNSLKIGVTLVILLNLQVVKACDNCNVFLSINPNDYQNSLSLTFRSRYHFGTFNQFGLLHTKHGGTDLIIQDHQIEEYYRRLEIAGNYYWHPKWKAQVVVPYVSNTQLIDGKTNYIMSGIGDPLVIQNFQVFSTRDTEDSLTFNHRWEVGAGVKMPAGSISRSFANGKPNIDLQTGSGSWDGILTTSYVARFKKIGWSTQINYKLNTKNKEQFKYGNTLNFQSTFFYLKTINKITIMPIVGVYAEKFENESSQGFESTDSDGSIWFVDMEINVFIRKLRFTGNFQPMFTSVLKDSYALPIKSRFSVGMNYTF